MPKELIYNPSVLDGKPQEVVEHLAVSWATGRDVQVGLTVSPRAEFTIDGKSSDFPSVWMDIDRAGINRLIHSLRKARDAAYGKDA